MCAQATRWDNYLRIFDPKIRESCLGRCNKNLIESFSRLVQFDQLHIFCCIPVCYGLDDPVESSLQRCEPVIFPRFGSPFDQHQISRYNATDLSVSAVSSWILTDLTVL